ncbi:MAG: hypothetical protein ACI8TQ_001623 [Planctomycetota bacterium]|jgi:hypothetical protein
MYRIRINWLGLLVCAQFAFSCGTGGGSASEAIVEPEEPPSASATVLPDSCPSGSGNFPNTTCVVLRIESEDTGALDVEVRIIEPAASTPLIGTVLLSSGGPGELFYSETAGGDLLITELLAAGHRVVDRRWSAGWFSTGEGVKQQSVRYATLLNWVHENVHTTGTFCATGNSAGAAEIAYALTTWDLSSILDRVVLTSGPPFSRLDFACDIPSSPEWLSICPANVPAGVMECGVPECTTENQVACQQVVVDPEPGELEANSLLHPGAILDYPTTDFIMLIGALDCTNAVPLSLHFFNAVTSFASLAFIPNTPHLLSTSVEGRSAISDALVGVLPTAEPVPATQFQSHYSYSYEPSANSAALRGVVYDPVRGLVTRQVIVYESR